MRDENEIVISELRRQAKGMLPLMLITYGVFALLGYWQWQTALSILLGSAYALFNFYQIGQSALPYTRTGPARHGARLSDTLCADSGGHCRFLQTAVA